MNYYNIVEGLNKKITIFQKKCAEEVKADFKKMSQKNQLIALSDYSSKANMLGGKMIE